MTKIIMHGCGGRMGRMITELAEKDENVQIVAGVDVMGAAGASYPVYGSVDEVTEEADAVIDFSTAKAVDGLLDWCAQRKLPVVVCTTGLSDAQMEKLHSTAASVAVLKSANMSIDRKSVV